MGPGPYLPLLPPLAPASPLCANSFPAQETLCLRCLLVCPIFFNTSLRYNLHTIQLKWAIEWLLVYFQNCDHHHNLISRYFHHSQKKSCTIISSHIHSPASLSSPRQRPVDVLSTDLIILDILDQWDYKTYGLWWLASLQPRDNSSNLAGDVTLKQK